MNLKNLLIGLVCGILFGLVCIVYKRHKLLKNGIGIEVQYLHLDTHLFALLRKTRTAYKPKEFNTIAQTLDNLVRCIIQGKPAPLVELSLKETPETSQIRAAIKQLMDYKPPAT